MSSEPKRRKRDDKMLEKLVKAVRRRRALWDKTTPLNKNVRVVGYSWRQVADELNMNEQYVKKIWQSLKNGFVRLTREYKTVGETDGGRAKERLSSWPMYHHLQFLTANEHSKIEFKNYKMSDEEHAIIAEAKEYEMIEQTKPALLKISEPLLINDLMTNNSSAGSSVIVLDESEEESMDQTDLSQPPPLRTINPGTSILPNVTTQSEDANKPIATLTNPPPLRLIVNKKSANSLNTSNVKTTYVPPFKMFKPTPRHDDHSESDAADLNFLKSLLPFMRAFPLKDKIRIRNGIHNLILNELNAINQNDDYSASCSLSPAPPDDRVPENFPTALYEESVKLEDTYDGDEKLEDTYDGGEKLEDDNALFYTIIVKEECKDYKDDVIKISSTNLTFEGEDNDDDDNNDNAVFSTLNGGSSPEKD